MEDAAEVNESGIILVDVLSNDTNGGSLNITKLNSSDGSSPGGYLILAANTSTHGTQYGTSGLTFINAMNTQANLSALYTSGNYLENLSGIHNIDGYKIEKIGDEVTILAQVSKGDISIIDNKVNYDTNSQFDYLSSGEVFTETVLYTTDNGDTEILTVTVTGDSVPVEAVDDFYEMDEHDSFGGIIVLSDEHVVHTGPILPPEVITLTDNSGVVVNPTGEAGTTYELIDGYVPGATTDVVNISDNSYVLSFNIVDHQGIIIAPNAMIDVLSNDIGDDTPFDISSIDTSSTIGQADISISINTGSPMISYSQNGQFDYLSEGEVAFDTVDYVVTDSKGASDSATLTITINGKNDLHKIIVDPVDNFLNGLGALIGEFSIVDVDNNDTHDVIISDERLEVSEAGFLKLKDDVTIDFDDEQHVAFDITVIDQNENVVTEKYFLFSDGLTQLKAFDDIIHVSEDQPGYLQEQDIIKSAVVVMMMVLPVGPATGDVIVIMPPFDTLINPVEIDVLANDLAGDDLYIDSLDNTNTIGEARLNADSNLLYFPNSGPILYSPLGRFEYLAAGETAIDTINYTATDHPGVILLGIDIFDPLYDTATVTVVINGENDAPTDISLTPIDSESGSEFLVNTYTDFDQADPSTTVLKNGNFVIAWDGAGQQDSSGVYAQIFDASGSKIGSEFLVNDIENTSTQWRPSVASLDNGSFVVTWEAYGQIDSGTDIFAQLFDVSGAKIGNEFLVNTTTTDNQYRPVTTALDNGNFVVTWYSENQDGSSYGVYAQIFNSSVVKIGNEFLVNSYTLDGQYKQSVTALEDGKFVVTWESLGPEDALYDYVDIYAQIFDANGIKVGGEFRVNSETLSYQLKPAVSLLANGNFVVTWESQIGDGSDYGIRAQIFDPLGNKIGGEFIVNSYNPGPQYNPAVLGLANGTFLISWFGEGAEDDFGIQGQYFDINGNKIGEQFLVNDTIAEDQGGAFESKQKLTQLDDGNVLVTWGGNGVGDDDGVHAKILQSMLSVAENDLGVVIGNLAVVDIDYSDTHTLTVDDERFEIIDGQLKLKDGIGLDFESGDSVVVNITAEDEGGLSVSKDFTIKVTNVDDNDIIEGTSEDDTLNGGIGNDFINGLAGNDILLGESGNDLILGDEGDDVIMGNFGRDSLFGGQGEDVIFGGLGQDLIAGGENADILTGGLGPDSFIFNNLSDSTSAESDLIRDFQVGIDNINLSGLSDEGVSSFSDLTIFSNAFNTFILATDPGTDFRIILSGSHNLDENDFTF